MLRKVNFQNLCCNWVLGKRVSFCTIATKTPLRQGQPEKAIACYQQVLQKSPELWEVHHKLGDVLWQQGEVEAAVEAYQQATGLLFYSLSIDYYI
ncbi:tetratricopeptide repeat protein [Planktothrix tepida]|uniref:tetratricopeptide repeat protein n=1 Tax=Planktothrix tepida TaxID=1678309 RepID=UPI0009355217|nr:tetratricopeptide repeat protein [Planktothrix tepida]